MFSKEEFKKFTIKLGNKWFFPNFYNKVTWYVVTLGGGIIIIPKPFKLLVYNWIIESFNLNAGNTLTLAEMGDSTEDYWLGFFLIIAALLHNIFSKWLLHEADIQDRVKADKVRAVDEALFIEFLEIFSSSSRSAYLLTSHDFGNSFRLEYLMDINKFIDEWNCPEKSFMNPELESMRKELWNKCCEFSFLLAEKSEPTPGDFQSVVPEQSRGNLSWPEWVDKDVKAINKMAKEVSLLHQCFIKSIRETLKC